MGLIDRLTRPTNDDGIGNYINGLQDPSAAPGVLFNGGSEADGSFDGSTFTYFYSTAATSPDVSGSTLGYIQLGSDESDGIGGINRCAIENGISGSGIGEMFGNIGFGYIGQTYRLDQNFVDGAVSVKVAQLAPYGDPDQKIRLWGRINNPKTSGVTGYYAEILGVSGNPSQFRFHLVMITSHNAYVYPLGGSFYLGALNVGDVLTLDCRGSTLLLKQNGVTRCTATDTTITTAGFWGIGCGKTSPSNGGFGVIELDLAFVYEEISTINPVTQFDAWEADFYSRSRFSIAEVHTTFDAATIRSASGMSGLDHICHNPPNLIYNESTRWQIYDGIAPARWQEVDEGKRFSCVVELNPETNPC